MAAITITEGLAELKTISKRLEKKRNFVIGFLTRAEGIKDPLEKGVPGGSVEAIKRERQAISDLENRHLSIRMAIQKINHLTTVTIGEKTMSVAEWLTWRKEVAPGISTFQGVINRHLSQVRAQAQQRGHAVVTVPTADTKPTDVVVNIDEHALATEMEGLETVTGTLDGKLSLINATTTIDV